jgi:choline dehydrogenase-like flavoprotein
MLRAALSTGRLDLIPNRVAIALSSGGPGGSVDGVIAAAAANRALECFKAPIIILAASAFESVRLLLNSKSQKFPEGVGNGRGLVGTRILEHMMVGLHAQLPASTRSANPTYGHNPLKLNAEPHGLYMPPFVHLENRGTKYRFGYGVQGTISVDTGLFYLGAFGETVPSDRNRIRLDESKKDRFGVPISSIDFSWDAEDLAMYKDSADALTHMIAAFESDSGMRLEHPLTARVHDLLTANRPPVPGSNHECGGARMGSDPNSSVVDPCNRVWDAPNVLVCDAACFPSIPHQNPTLTSMALALRAGRQLLSDR